MGGDLGSDDAAAARCCAGAGAVGYVPERSDLEPWSQPPSGDGGWHLRAAAQGRRQGQSGRGHCACKPEVLMPGLALTPRQRQVLPLLAAGQQNKEIARELHLKAWTPSGDQWPPSCAPWVPPRAMRAVAMLQKSDGH